LPCVGKEETANGKKNDGYVVNAIENETTCQMTTMVSDLHIGLISKQSSSIKQA